MSLAELSRRLGMGKPTLLRTARTLARSGYLVQMEDRRWRLGPAAGWLGVRYQTPSRPRQCIPTFSWTNGGGFRHNGCRRNLRKQ